MKTYRLRDTFSEDGWYLTQSYGNNPAYYSQFNLLYHEGIDIGHKEPNKVIRVVHDGVVIRDEDIASGGRNYGKLVVLWDDKQLCATYYCHLQRNTVSVGQRVSAGDIIGYEDSTGNSTGEHCHFNFVQTDDKGNRRYQLKQYNWGYLDPQYPRDPGLPKFPGGMAEYKVEWYTGNHQEPENPMDDQKLATEMRKLIKHNSGYTTAEKVLSEISKRDSAIGEKDSRIKELEKQVPPKRIPDSYRLHWKEVATGAGENENDVKFDDYRALDEILKGETARIDKVWESELEIEKDKNIALFIENKRLNDEIGKLERAKDEIGVKLAKCLEDCQQNGDSNGQEDSAWNTLVSIIAKLIKSIQEKL